MGLFNDDAIFLATNGLLDLYITDWTKQYTDKLNRRENYGYFENAMVVEVRRTGTDNRMAYAVISKDYKDIYFDFNDSFDFDFKLLAYKRSIDKKNNIINMAKNKNKKKKKKAIK